MLPEADSKAKEALAAIWNEPLKLAWALGYDKLVHRNHRDWIVRPWAFGKDHLTLAHRNSYKTTSRVVSAIFGGIFWPNETLLLIRKSHEEASKILQEIMDHYDREPLRKIYAALGIMEPRNMEKWSAGQGASLATRTRVTKERTWEVAGIGKARTGAHFDLIWPDDIVTMEDRYYRAERERVKAVVRELQNIKSPKSRGIAFTGTCWHEQDAYAEIERTMPTTRHPISECFIPDLTPERLADIRSKMTDSEWAANYELRHVPEGSRPFAGPTFMDPPPGLDIYGYLDPAFTDDEKADSTALIFGGTNSGRLHIPAAQLWRADISSSYDRVVEAYHENRCQRLYVEANSAQVAVIAALRSKGLDVQAVKSVSNKHFRIAHYARRNWAKVAWSPDLDGGAFLAEVLDYVPHATHDDAPDALAGLCAVFLTARGGKVSVSELSV